MSEEINIKEIEKYIPEDVPTMQEQTLTSLSMMIMNTLSSESPRQYIRLYQYIKILAKRLKRKEIETELDSLYFNTPIRKNLSLPLAILNYTYDKDSYAGYSPMKTYTINLEDRKDGTIQAPTYFHRLAKKKVAKKIQISLSEIIMALDLLKVRMIDIYTELAIDHNIELSTIQQPELSGDAMPQL